jgi:hypothetical protein
MMMIGPSFSLLLDRKTFNASVKGNVTNPGQVPGLWYANLQSQSARKFSLSPNMWGTSVDCDTQGKRADEARCSFCASDRDFVTGNQHYGLPRAQKSKYSESYIRFIFILLILNSHVDDISRRSICGLSR